jgi:hypothetical protein
MSQQQYVDIETRTNARAGKTAIAGAVAFSLLIESSKGAMKFISELSSPDDVVRQIVLRAAKAEMAEGPSWRCVRSFCIDARIFSIVGETSCRALAATRGRCSESRSSAPA